MSQNNRPITEQVFTKQAFICLVFQLTLSLGCAFLEKQIASQVNHETAAVQTAIATAANTAILPSQPSLLATGTLASQLTSTQALSASDLSSLASALEWTYSGGYTSLRVPISGDIQAAGPLVFLAADLAVPGICMARPDCRQAVAIEISAQLPSITCSQTEQVLWKETCAEASIPAGTRFRMRGILYDTHPAQWNYIPILQILPPSEQPCLDGELRCSEDNTCFDSFDDYCRSCLGLEKERCACQSPQGDLPDGRDCQYRLSGDVLQPGKCKTGICK